VTRQLPAHPAENNKMGEAHFYLYADMIMKDVLEGMSENWRAYPEQFVIRR